MNLVKNKFWNVLTITLSALGVTALVFSVFILVREVTLARKSDPKLVSQEIVTFSLDQVGQLIKALTGESPKF